MGDKCHDVRNRRNAQRRAIATAVPCEICQQPRGQTHVGRCCWRCYRRIIGDDMRENRIVDADRERRIEMYAARAASGLPLFDGGK